MANNPLKSLHSLGQSFWYDNIQRNLLENGEMQRMIDEYDLRGVTSNPSIFEKAITASHDYDAALAKLSSEQPDASGKDYFFALAIQDIQQAADLLRPVYDASNAQDGYVSLEVSPDLAYDAQASIKEARELFIRLGRPNVMIKIPATEQGLEAIETLIADGINVNATLLFTVERYIHVAQAFIRGLSTRAKQGKSIENIASVASFFVSRVDSALDEALDAAIANGQSALADLKGKLAVANAKAAYLQYQALFSSNEFMALADKGAQVQRLLWASTGTKNPDYSDILYIEELIGDHTVNTMPPTTLQAFQDHGSAASTLTVEMDKAAAMLQRVRDASIDLDAIMLKLEKDGVDSFATSFDNLVKAIEHKIKTLDSDSSSNAA